jgi:hypothetical protein
MVPDLNGNGRVTGCVAKDGGIFEMQGTGVYCYRCKRFGKIDTVGIDFVSQVHPIDDRMSFLCHVCLVMTETL